MLRAVDDSTMDIILYIIVFIIIIIITTETVSDQ